jgi:hypothetical protein
MTERQTMIRGQDGNQVVLMGVYEIVVYGVSELVFFNRREGLLERHVVVRAGC